jgi:hypothetical protein
MAAPKATHSAGSTVTWQADTTISFIPDMHGFPLVEESASAHSVSQYSVLCQVMQSWTASAGVA